MLQCESPIIARVNGDAMGLARPLHCSVTIVIADETARIADPHVSVSLPGSGGAIICHSSSATRAPSDTC